MTVTTIEAHGRTYRINNPGTGRVGSKLNMGIPYEQKLLNQVYNDHHTGVAFDIGAHVGNHTLFFAAVCGLTVHAWEPYDLSRGMLEDNIALNPGLDITVHPWAAGDRHTRGRFTTGMWLEFDPERDGDTLKLERGHIPVHPIDDEVNIQNVAVVKIDVEGMESEVLAGMVNHLDRDRPVVYTEAHTDHDLLKIRRVIGPLGYKVVRYLHMGSRQVRWEV